MDMIMEKWDLIFGVLLAVISLGLIVKATYERKTGFRCKGTIVGFSKGEKGALFPVVQFTYGGETYSMSTMNGSKKPKKGVGTETEVIYCPKNQKYVIEVGNYSDVWICLACAGMGIVLLAFYFLG